MAERRTPALYTIPPHRAFADALVAGLIATHGKDRMTMARGRVLVPNHRAALSIRDAFVRQSERGLLLPRLVTIGDIDDDLGAGLAFDGADGTPIPPAVEPLQRQLILARLVQNQMNVGAHEAMRLAEELGRTLDQLQIERIDPAKLRSAPAEEFAEHWQRSLTILNIIFELWPRELAALGRIDLADRRNLLLDRVADQWRSAPPQGFVVAAGISTAAPAIAALLRLVAFMPTGQIVLAGLDQAMPDVEWDAVRGSENDAPIETHPQFHLCLLLDRMGVARTDVALWRWGSDVDARAARSRAISNAMAPAIYTSKWAELSATDRSTAGLTGVALPTEADEAQAIAILMRGAIEEPGKTAALVTPDRKLARRVSAHLKRYGIDADDSAGQPLSESPHGTLILALAEAVTQRFAPVQLLAVLKHPLVRSGEARLTWLDGVRRLDRALRGPRPAEGLAGLSAYLASGDDREIKLRAPAGDWWSGVVPLLSPIETSLGARSISLATAVAALRETLVLLAGDSVWQGVAGRAAADLFDRLERDAALGPADIAAPTLTPLLRQLMAAVAVRHVERGHPRLFIWGLIEARLQSAQLMILGGLNEGSWPALPSPDPWLAPQIRKTLGLPALERRIGLAAHDLAAGLGAPEVVMTRARRDAGAPAIASRFWLRIDAMAGGLRAPVLDVATLASAIDRPTGPQKRASRPAPTPPLAARPKSIVVTAVDRLKVDPFAFYAQAILKLSAIDMIDAVPGPAWRGTIIHAVLDTWAREDGYHPEALRGRIISKLAEPDKHPLLRSLWQPRLIEAADFIASRVAQAKLAGRVPIVSEVRGRAEIAGITLTGRVDRIDRADDGSLVIIDYKTGAAPPAARIEAGYALQLGLMGYLAEQGAFKGADGIAGGFEYWLLSKDQKTRSFGKVRGAVGGRGSSFDPADLTSAAYDHFAAAAARWLHGDAPFTAKLHPQYSPYADYDQLMRYEEWRGRE